MNLASWYALIQTTKKQEIHGAFTGQIINGIYHHK